MFNWKKEKEQYETQIHNFKRSIELRKEDKENLKLKLNNDNLNNKLYETASKCPMVIDWNIIKVFSVERTIMNGTPITNIGYILDSKILQWNLYCSEEIHNKLVNDFIEWKKKIYSCNFDGK